MKTKTILYVDQWGNHFKASSVKELRSKIGGGGCRVSKMYQDGKNGETFHVGYVIGNHWLNAFSPMRVSVKN